MYTVRRNSGVMATLDVVISKPMARLPLPHGLIQSNPDGLFSVGFEQATFAVPSNWLELGKGEELAINVNGDWRRLVTCTAEEGRITGTLFASNATNFRLGAPNQEYASGDVAVQIIVEPLDPNIEPFFDPASGGLPPAAQKVRHALLHDAPKHEGLRLVSGSMDVFKKEPGKLGYPVGSIVYQDPNWA